MNGYAKKFEDFVVSMFGEDLVVVGEYKGIREPLDFRCKTHGIIQLVPATIKGTRKGCPHCNHGKKFLDKAKEVHGDLYTYNLSDYKDSRTLMQIKCNKHDKYFMQRPSAHLQGQNCPDCGRESSANSMTKDEDVFISQVRSVHGDKYDTSLIKYESSKNQVTLICKEHGRFQIRPSNLLKGGGCRECAVANITSNTEEFIDKALSIHGNKYDYSKVNYTLSQNKVEIYCPRHDLVFRQKPNKHLSGRGCPSCAIESKGRWGVSSVERNKNKTTKLPCYFYIIRIPCLGNNIYKIGITKDKKIRFNQLSRELGSDIVFLSSVKTNLYTSVHLEQFLKDMFKIHRFNSPVSFGGHTETYTLEEGHVDFILSFIEDIKQKEVR